MRNKQDEMGGVERTLSKIADVGAKVCPVACLASMMLFLPAAGLSKDKIEKLKMLEAVGAEQTSEYRQLYQDVESEKEIASEGIKYGAIGLAGTLGLLVVSAAPYSLYSAYMGRRKKRNEVKLGRVE